MIRRVSRRRLGILAVMGMGLAGCATSIPQEVGRAPNEDEQRIIDTFAPQVVAAARQEGFACATVTFAMADLRQDSLLSIARPSLNRCAFFIKVSTHYLRTDPPVALAGTLAHELGHVIDGDWTPGRARVVQIDRERQADAVAIRILKRIGMAECLAQVERFRKTRAENIRAWGMEQRDTITTHPSYTERIKTFEAGCRQ